MKVPREEQEIVADWESQSSASETDGELQPPPQKRANTVLGPVHNVVQATEPVEPSPGASSSSVVFPRAYVLPSTPSPHAGPSTLALTAVLEDNGSVCLVDGCAERLYVSAQDKAIPHLGTHPNKFVVRRPCVVAAYDTTVKTAQMIGHHHVTTNLHAKTWCMYCGKDFSQSDAAFSQQALCPPPPSMLAGPRHIFFIPSSMPLEYEISRSPDDPAMSEPKGLERKSVSANDTIAEVLLDYKVCR
ncbi:hypothetical protein BD311DRAFT_692451 [Dichomitus squalens]|uniref:Uncharacterized protein n=1 Tax=Dichomitus squalens TaxID=114155 RepID=A0A4Q9MR91_9APHY|nr:hypothetical protein BD311DRAFT_692451 [Dichomitus squalens]